MKISLIKTTKNWIARLNHLIMIAKNSNFLMIMLMIRPNNPEQDFSRDRDIKLQIYLRLIEVEKKIDLTLVLETLSFCGMDLVCKTLWEYFHKVYVLLHQKLHIMVMLMVKVYILLTVLLHLLAIVVDLKILD